jgi:hypothetical protein
MFKDGRNFHDEKLSGWPSVASADFLQIETRRFTISEISYEFPQISRTGLYETITIRISYHKFYARWVPKILTGGPSNF